MRVYRRITVERELFAEFLESMKALVQSNVFNKRFVVIFGANATGSTLINYLRDCSIQVDAVIDNNAQLHHKYFLEILITSPQESLGIFRENSLILIASKYYEEMKLQLEQYGYKEHEHIIQVLNLNKHARFNLSIETFEAAEQRVMAGYQVYKNLKQNYGDAQIVMVPVRPNGDVYMLCSYLKAYQERLPQSTQIVVTVIGNACEAVARLFKIKNLEKLTKEENDQLVAFANFFPDKIKVINPYTSHLELYQNMDGYNGLTFLDELKYGLLDLKHEDRATTPNHNYRTAIVEEIFQQYGLIEHQTVILAPYANSIPQIKLDFWEKIVVELQHRGYIVCTNCGTDEEQAIRGSLPVRFSFQDAVAVTERAGYLIAYRSGFCEIVADSKCKKVIVYPHHYIGHNTLRNFFGLDHEMYRQEGLIQIEHIFESTDELVERVLENF